MRLQALGNWATTIVAAAAILFWCPVLAQDHLHESDITADLIGEGGETIGHVDLFEGDHGVVIFVEASGLPPGAHGMHIHMTGDCDSASHFDSAGAHHNPGDQSHGFLAGKDDGHHAGALPNLIVHEDGTVRVELYSSTISLRFGDEALLDADGSSLVVHLNPDDHVSENLGGSGSRIACAVIAAP